MHALLFNYRCQFSSPIWFLIVLVDGKQGRHLDLAGVITAGFMWSWFNHDMVNEI